MLFKINSTIEIWAGSRPKQIWWGWVWVEPTNENIPFTTKHTLMLCWNWLGFVWACSTMPYIFAKHQVKQCIIEMEKNCPPQSKLIKLMLLTEYGLPNSKEIQILINIEFQSWTPKKYFTLFCGCGCLLGFIVYAFSSRSRYFINLVQSIFCDLNPLLNRNLLPSLDIPRWH